MAMPATLATAAKRAIGSDQPEKFRDTMLSAATRLARIRMQEEGQLELKYANRLAMREAALRECGRLFGASIAFLRRYGKNTDEIWEARVCIDPAELDGCDIGRLIKEDRDIHGSEDGAIGRAMRVAEAYLAHGNGKLPDGGAVRNVELHLMRIAKNVDELWRSRKRKDALSLAASLANHAAIAATIRGFGASALWIAVSGRSIEPIE